MDKPYIFSGTLLFMIVSFSSAMIMLMQELTH